VSIAQQIAMPTLAPKARRPAAPLQPAPAPNRTSTLMRLFGLMAITAVGASLIVGSIAIAVIMLASSMGG
jgi:hypothetical protein